MSIAGAGQFGPAPVVFDWKERFAEGSKGSELTATARVTPDLLNAFGLAARNFMQGEAAVRARAPPARAAATSRPSPPASISPTRSSTCRSSAGARSTTRRPRARSAMARTRRRRRGDRRHPRRRPRTDRRGAHGQGRRVRVGDDRAHLLARQRRPARRRHAARPDGGYRLALERPVSSTPARSWTACSACRRRGTDIHGEPVGATADPGPVFDIQLNADKLRLRENAEITDAKVAMAIDATGRAAGTVTDRSPRTRRSTSTIGTRGDAREPSRSSSDDAGFGARVLLKADYLIGGKLTLDGTFQGSDGEAMVTMTDVRLKDAPLVAQLFSLASPARTCGRALRRGRAVHARSMRRCGSRTAGSTCRACAPRGPPWASRRAAGSRRGRRS